MELQPPHIAVIGECLIELSGTAFGPVQQSVGGDTFNTAVYLARLAAPPAVVRYVTALGTDSLSDRMLERWRQEGIDVALTLRDAKRLPGLYQIEVDARGERRFWYWRSDSAARYLLQHPDFARIERELAAATLIYLSGISLAILPEPDRVRLTQLLMRLAAGGTAIAFDTNYRPALWPSVAAARAAVAALLPAVRLVFATFDDEHSLWGDAAPEATVSRYRAAKTPTLILKHGAAGCLHSEGAQASRIAAAPIATVVDTTAAGDSFNAAYLAAQLAGGGPLACCEAANRCAAIVIQHRGAIIPAAATPPLRTLLGTP